MLHNEGAAHVLARTFPIGGSFATQRTDWKLCISGINQMGIGDTPNGFPGPGAPPIDYDAETTYAEITHAYANEGGAEGGDGSTHAGIIGYTRKATTPSVENLGRAVSVRSGEKSFGNSILWAPWGSYDPDEFEPPDWSGEPWEPEHEYPWQTPTWKEDRWSDPWDDWFRENPHRAGSFTIGATFIASPTVPGILLASDVCRGGLSIKPNSTLWKRCDLLIVPPSIGDILTTAFLEIMAGRTFGSTSAPSAYRMVLASNPAGTLNHTSELGDVTAFGSGTNPTYADASVTSWAAGAAYQAVGTCAGWENEDASVTWEAATYACLVADVDSVATLCGVCPIDPPRALAPGDRLLLPSGVVASLITGA